jgi:hypothetical protein
MPHNRYFRDFILSSDTKKTTERTEDTENNYSSVISVSSVVEYTDLEQ